VATREDIADAECWFVFNTPSLKAINLQLDVNVTVSSVRLYKPKPGAFFCDEQIYYEKFISNLWTAAHMKNVK